MSDSYHKMSNEKLIELREYYTQRLKIYIREYKLDEEKIISVISEYNKKVEDAQTQIQKTKIFIRVVTPIEN